METRNLQVFLAVADAGSFSAAAKNAGITHTALIQQVNSLESEIGFKLFDRSYRGLALTDAGALFYDRARQMIDLSEKAIAEGRAAVGGTVRVAYAPGIPYHICTDICPVFTKAYPSCKVEFVNSDRADWVKDTIKGRIDVFENADCDWVHDKRLDFQFLCDDPLGCLVAPTDELASKPQITLGDLEGRGLRFQDERLCSSFIERLHDAGIACSLSALDVGVAEVMSACLSGDLVLMPRSYAPAYQPLVYIPIEAGEVYPVGLVFRKSPSPAVLRFVNLAVDLFDVPPQRTA